MKDEFWEQPEVVEQFAARDLDHRLRALMDEYAEPSAIRVLDLGCAGGRNTIPLAERGFDVWGVDASTAMVARARARLAEVLGASAAAEHVREGRMDDLSSFPAEHFDLIVALGIFHNARSRAEWQRAVGEAVRVMKGGGRLLVNHFTPAVDLTGEGLSPVVGEPDVYAGFPGGRVVLMEAADLDASMARFGLSPVVPSRTVAIELDRGRRVSVNALYRRD